jgi:hypothetical protein
MSTELSPELVNMIAAFAIGIANEFKHRNDPLTPEQVTARWNDHYAQFIAKNQALQDETKPHV